MVRDVIAGRETAVRSPGGALTLAAPAFKQGWCTA